MTNEEFAISLKDYLIDCGWVSTEDDEEDTNIKECIEEYLNGNSLQVVNLDEQLLGFSVDTILEYYPEWYAQHLEDHPDLPKEITKDQALWVLETGYELASQHDLGYTYEEIYMALDEWVKKGYPIYE